MKTEIAGAPEPVRQIPSRGSLPRDADGQRSRGLAIDARARAVGPPEGVHERVDEAACPARAARAHSPPQGSEAESLERRIQGVGYKTSELPDVTRSHSHLPHSGARTYCPTPTFPVGSR